MLADKFVGDAVVPERFQDSVLVKVDITLYLYSRPLVFVIPGLAVAV